MLLSVAMNNKKQGGTCRPENYISQYYCFLIRTYMKLVHDWRVWWAFFFPTTFFICPGLKKEKKKSLEANKASTVPKVVWFSLALALVPNCKEPIFYSLLWFFSVVPDILLMHFLRDHKNDIPLRIFVIVL